MFKLDAESGENALKMSHGPVALHIVVAALMICLVPATALWMSIEHNRHALSASKELVDNAVSLLRARAFTLVRDYSIWDEGFDAVLRDDRAWLYANIGSSVIDLGTFDLVLLVVPGRPETVGWVAGSPPEGETGLLPPETLTPVLALADANAPATPDTRTLFAEFLGEPWLFSISPMTPSSGAPPGTTPELLPLQIHGYQLNGGDGKLIGEAAIKTRHRRRMASTSHPLPRRGGSRKESRPALDWTSFGSCC